MGGRVGRNDPCSCGSGKKSKRCCGRGLPIARECGECTACCTALGIVALGKEAGCDCPHASAGCGIYAERPDECRSYSCEWKKGKYRDEDRPDRVGIVVDNGVNHEFRRKFGVGAVVARELYLKEERDSHTRSGVAINFMRRLQEDGKVIFVMPHPGSACTKRSMICTDERRKRLALKAMKNALDNA